jgi:hypothetical protein
MPALLIIPAVILVVLLGLLAIAPNMAISQEFDPTPPYSRSELIKDISSISPPSSVREKIAISGQ